jgi:hypothetical protein
MTAEDEETKTPTLDESIESTPRPIDARTMTAIVQYEYGSAREDPARNRRSGTPGHRSSSLHTLAR